VLNSLSLVVMVFGPWTLETLLLLLALLYPAVQSTALSTITLTEFSFFQAVCNPDLDTLLLVEHRSRLLLNDYHFLRCQLRHALQDEYGDVTEEAITNAFHKVDTNSDGTLSSKEFESVIRRLLGMSITPETLNRTRYLFKVLNWRHHETGISRESFESFVGVEEVAAAKPHELQRRPSALESETGGDSADELSETLAGRYRDRYSLFSKSSRKFFLGSSDDSPAASERGQGGEGYARLDEEWSQWGAGSMKALLGGPAPAAARTTKTRAGGAAAQYVRLADEQELSA